MEKALYPLKMRPVFRDYIWGGDKLKTGWGKATSLSKIAESWELSAYPGYESRVAEGAFEGLTIEELKALFPKILGKKAENFPVFPLLVKLIDASNDLSIQVHPDDSFAKEHENQLGKTEMWYIAEADEDAAIFYGFNKDIGEDELKECIRGNTLCPMLNRVGVKPGDCFFVPAGTVHAILSGITVLEIQENSGVTYRLYDYGRKDASGKERELHIDKALKVVNKRAAGIEQGPKAYTQYAGYKIRELADCRYFTSREVIVGGEYPIYDADTFITLTVLSGSGVFDGKIAAEKGDTFFIPAGLKTVLSGDLKIIETTL